MISASAQRFTTRLLIGITTAALAASCVLPEQEQAEIIEDVPDDVLAPVSTTSTALPEAESDAPFELVLYWHESEQGKLIRAVRPSSVEPTPDEAFFQLKEGPTELEIAETGLRSFGANAGLTDVELAPTFEGPTDGILTVRVGGSGFRELPNKANAAAELVCTLTELAGVTGIVVYDALPDPINLVGSNAESIDGPAGRANFGDCLVEPTPGAAVPTTGG